MLVDAAADRTAYDSGKSGPYDSIYGLSRGSVFIRNDGRYISERCSEIDGERYTVHQLNRDNPIWIRNMAYEQEPYGIHETGEGKQRELDRKSVV